MGIDQIRSAIDWLVQKQSVMVATNNLFFTIAVIFVVAACVIWLAPKPRHAVDPAAVH